MVYYPIINKSVTKNGTLTHKKAIDNLPLL
jgi:hypothetical protein